MTNSDINPKTGNPIRMRAGDLTIVTAPNIVATGWSRAGTVMTIPIPQGHYAYVNGTTSQGRQIRIRPCEGARDNGGPCVWVRRGDVQRVRGVTARRLGWEPLPHAAATCCRASDVL